MSTLGKSISNSGKLIPKSGILRANSARRGESPKLPPSSTYFTTPCSTTSLRSPPSTAVVMPSVTPAIKSGSSTSSAGTPISSKVPASTSCPTPDASTTTGSTADQSSLFASPCTMFFRAGKAVSKLPVNHALAPDLNAPSILSHVLGLGLSLPSITSENI